MKKRLTPRASHMIEQALRRFPELAGKTITVGYTRAYLGSASVVYRSGNVSRLIIRLKVRKLTYQTIGHELTHLIQGLTTGQRPRSLRATGRQIPAGEKPCDIWTIARDPLFCDDPPTYLRLPRSVRQQWMQYANAVRVLCLKAITRRKTHRLYIRWLESELKQLGKKTPQPLTDRQLWLPFSG